MPATRFSETLLATRDRDAPNDPSDDRIAPPIIVVIITCSVAAFFFAAAMAFFCLSRSDKRAKRTSTPGDHTSTPALDHYTQPPLSRNERALRQSRFDDEKRSVRKYSYSSSTSGASSSTGAHDSAPVLPFSEQAGAIPASLATLPLARISSSPSMYSQTSTVDTPARIPPFNRRRSSTVHSLVDVETGRTPPPQPTRVSLPLSLRPAPLSVPPPSRSVRDTMTVEQMLELMPDARLSYAVMF
ncbi:hypothetical protein PENSPDRAFT_645371 [Peniophora sp. CONT]|nr:hypothetical protein PENSPDRAFT_645371 [Peniophora sp. CONT]